MQDESQKFRKKMYKSGKFWVAAGALFVGLAFAGNTQADTVLPGEQRATETTQTTQTSEDTSATKTPASASTSSSVNVDTSDLPDSSSTVVDSTSASASIVSDSVVVPDTGSQFTSSSASMSSSFVKSSLAATTSDASGSQSAAVTSTTVSSVATSSSASSVTTATSESAVISSAVSDGYHDEGGDWVYYRAGKKLVGRQTIDTFAVYFDADGKQVKGDWRESDGKRAYYDGQEGRALTQTQAVNGVIYGFNQSGYQIKNDFGQTANRDTYYFDAQGHVVTGIQTIANKVYDFDEQGRMLKGIATSVDDKMMYFDDQTGVGQPADHPEFNPETEPVPDDNIKHNAAHGTTPADFDSMAGYLTADTWYRPTDILENGETWRESQPTEFRPLLATWWPTKQTQADYVNYMNHALDMSNASVSAADSEATLTAATDAIQAAVEHQITVRQSTAWLRELMAAFVVTQPQWNKTSEDVNDDHLQGGALTFENNGDTDANSDYRLMNRTPTNQTGERLYHIDDSLGGYELLLANDVDNSNPQVQAEQLNWLYYLMNFGDITADDPDANFDAIRIDAVDNVDADLLQLAAQYFRDAYGMATTDATSNKHLSILEDWSHNDPAYMQAHGNDQLTMDDYMHTQLIWSLTKPEAQRGTMARFMDFYLTNRANDDTENMAQPSYSFVRAHDSEVQTVIAEIVTKLHPEAGNGLMPTEEQMAEAFKIYNADQKKAVKTYTHYNMPSAYAMLLTNKDVIPRIYYGDLYTDDGQFMATKSPYFDAISAMLQARTKYVGGGQTMAVDQHDVLTSVRFGKGAMTASDLGNAETRTEGVGLIISNNPKLQLGQQDNVVLHMGLAHANQAFRAVVLTTATGLTIYNDDDAPIRYTDNKGDLIFNNHDVYGVLNPQVSGFLAMWVPTGAPANQDARSTASTNSSTDGSAYHSNAALDSQVIFESFSNFQAMPTSHDTYTNVVLANHADQLHDWGITSVQLAPQYRSSTDGTFLDAIIQNGYAFTDRYDLGFGTPTKYGDDTDLRNVIKALHANGMQVMADFVPDQLYTLPGKELVQVTRTNNMGEPDTHSDIQHILYVTSTRGGGEYQKQYGGEFLERLRALYPDLFTTRQISTGQTIDDSVKIKEWSAKYLNGTAIQGRGAGYVLRDNGTNAYYKVTANDGNVNLPKQLLGQPVMTGFYHEADGYHFETLSGTSAKDAFIMGDDGALYYFDDQGVMVTGKQRVHQDQYFFLPNGIALTDAFVQSADGQRQYYDKTGRLVINQYVTDHQANAFRVDADGNVVRNQALTVDGHEQYFGTNGVQAKAVLIRTDDNQARYYEANSGNLVKQQFILDTDGHWLYADAAGDLARGQITVGQDTLYFDDNNHQVKDDFVYDTNGVHYFNGTTGAEIKQDYAFHDGKWYYFDDLGRMVTGLQRINGEYRYFDANGVQLKGGTVTDPLTHQTYTFDAQTGVGTLVTI